VILSENSSQQKQLENSSEHIKELMQEIYNLQADLRRKKEQVEEMEQEMGLTQVTQQTAGLSIFERRLI
jgi:uncharacterized protein YhaN